MKWIMSLFGRRNNRNAFGRRGTMMMSVLALAIGANYWNEKRSTEEVMAADASTV